MKNLCFIIFMALMSSCGESGRITRLPTNSIGENQNLLDLKMLSYSFEGSCAGEKSHRLVSFPGLIEYEPDSERYLIHHLEMALYFDNSTYDMAITSYYADDADYTPTVEMMSGAIGGLETKVLELENVGEIVLEIQGQKIRPRLTVDPDFLSEVVSTSNVGLVLRKSTSVLFPDCFL